MKTGMKSFVLVSIILAFFTFSLSGCKGKKEEETQISQQAAQTKEKAKKPEPETKEEAKQEEKEEVEEDLPFLKGVEEVDVPKFIWKIKIENDLIGSVYIVDKERERELIEESDSFSQILSEESAAPFFLLKGKEKQYLVDIKGNIRKEIQYPSSDLVIVFDKKTKKVIGKTRGGEDLWEKEWEIKYEKSKISADGNWAILFPTPDPGYTLSAGENIVSIDKNGKELWRVDYSDRKGGLTGWPSFSDNGKKLAFGIHDTLYYASKEKIIWEKKFSPWFMWMWLDISPSGNFIILPEAKIYLIDKSGLILWRWEDNILKKFVPRKYGYSKKEKVLLFLGRKKIPKKSPYFNVAINIETGKVVKKTKEWIKSDFPLYRGILDHNSYLKIFQNKYLMLGVPGGTYGLYMEVYLYKISHILTLCN
ncbi:MAG: hypothetical protein KAU46_06580 [Candidatus Aminicenantes bacterium]|nr:hypothetical protein [Candidatus Aminicenantes bacterium]